MPSASPVIMALSAVAEVDSLETRISSASNYTVAGPIASAVRMKLASTGSAYLHANADRMHYAMFVITNRNASVLLDTEGMADKDVVHRAIRAIPIHVV